jgi:hypothetical protein
MSMKDPAMVNDDISHRLPQSPYLGLPLPTAWQRLQGIVPLEIYSLATVLYCIPGRGVDC